MAEPLGTVAAIAELTSLVKKGFSAVVKRQPEFHRFWRHFERQLQPEFRDVPWQRINDRFSLDPEFVSLICCLIRGERHALNRLEELFEEELEPPEGSRYDKATVVSTVLSTVRESANQAVQDFKGAARQSTGLLEGRVGEAQGAITDEVRRGTSQLAGGQAQLLDQMASLKTQFGVLESELRGRGEKPERSRPTGAEGHSPEARPLPSLSERADSWRPPQELVDELAAEDPSGAEHLRGLLAEGGPGAIVSMIRTRQQLNDSDSLPYLVTAARIVAGAGAFAEAEEVYLWASQLPCLDDRGRARQLVRAAAMAQVHSGEARFSTLLEEAKLLVPEHPGVALAEARASTDPQWILNRVAEVEPENEADAALLHVTRAQAQLAVGNEDEAGRELADARSADDSHIAVREFESVLVLVTAQRGIGRGEPPDHEALRRAADGLQSLRTHLDAQARWDESAHVAARASQAYALADDHDAAVGVIESVKRVERLSDEARSDLGRSALITRRPDLVLTILSAGDDRPEARLLRADAQALGGDAQARQEAVTTLIELLDHPDEETQRDAAFALLAAASSGTDIAWNERAAALVRGVKPLTAALFRAEHLRLHGALEAAESELLGHADSPHALRVLRDYAVERRDREKAKDRSRTLMRGRPTDRDRLGNADILHRTGDRSSAREEFFAIARDEELPEELREAAFAALTEIVGEGRDYRAVREVAAEWHDSLPASRNGVWNLAFSLARTSAHAEAFKLLQEAQPEPQTLPQAQLATEIFSRAAPKAEAVERIERLSSLFAQEEQLEAALVLAFVDLDEEERGGLPAGLVDDIEERVASFPDRFPNSKVLWTVDAPETAEELTALMREIHGESAQRQQQLEEELSAGEAPVNALAVVSPVGQVGSAWGKITSLPLAFSMPALDEHERDVARQAVGARPSGTRRAYSS